MGVGARGRGSEWQPHITLLCPINQCKLRYAGDEREGGKKAHRDRRLDAFVFLLITPHAVWHRGRSGGIDQALPFGKVCSSRMLFFHLQTDDDNLVEIPVCYKCGWRKAVFAPRLPTSNKVRQMNTLTYGTKVMKENGNVLGAALGELGNKMHT